MMDTNWKTGIVIFVLIVCGAFEIIKHLPSQGQTSNWNMADLIGGGSSSPYSVKSERTQSTDDHRVDFRKSLRSQSQSVTPEQLEKFVAANAVTGKGAEGTPEIQAAKAKDDAKKKKKKQAKKKKKAKSVDENVATSTPDSSNDHKSSDLDLNDVLHQAATTGTVPQQNSPDDPYASIEEWARRLLSYPNLAETLKFIDHFQNHLVTADIFYKIVDMMLEDSRTEMKLLGVLAAGQTPSLTSFLVLADVIKTATPRSELRSYANEFMSRYRDAHNLAILEKVLRAPTSSYTLLLATIQVDQAAQRLLTIRTPSTNSSQEIQALEAKQKKNATYFQRFMTILAGLKSSSDDSVRTQAELTLNHLAGLLAPSQTTQTAALDQ